MSVVSGVILCGGEGRRMHGVDKPLQLLHGAPLVHHVRSRLAPQVSDIVISANRNHEQYRRFVGDDAILADIAPGLGPLGGIHTAIVHTSTPMLFACPGDAPFLHEQLVARLLESLDANPDANAAIPFDGTRSQHLFLLIRTSMRNSLATYLARGERSAHGFVAECHPVIVDGSDIAESFRNINTTSELATAESIAAPAV